MDIHLLEKDDQIVISLKETISDQDYNRSISGSLNGKEKNFSFKECNKAKINGKLLNISLSFRNMIQVEINQLITHSYCKIIGLITVKKVIELVLPSSNIKKTIFAFY